MRHVITGEPAMVWAALRRAHEEGRLVRVEQGRQIAGGQVELLAQLHPVPTRSRWERVRPWLVWVAKLAAVLVAVAVVVGLVWLVVLAVLEVVALVAALVAWVQAHVIQIGLTVAAVLALLVCAAGGGHRCGGMHCGGCRR